MSSLQLFFGLALDATWLAALQEVDPPLYQAFVSNDEWSLHRVCHEGIDYLGKPMAADALELAEIELLDSNIRSLLQKLFPSTSLASYPLELFPYLSERRG